jgi:nucleotide-binding universal stress UspA family protein
VVADDGSEDARRAGELAAGIGGLFGAEGVIVQVYPRVLKSTQERSALESKIADHATREAEAELAQRAEELAPLLGLAPEVRLVLDEAAEGADGVAPTILEEAAGGPSLISVGRRGLGAVQRARVGSVSTKVVRAAEGPVLVYPHTCGADPEDGADGS